MQAGCNRGSRSPGGYHHHLLWAQQGPLWLDQGQGDRGAGTPHRSGPIPQVPPHSLLPMPLPPLIIKNFPAATAVADVAAGAAVNGDVAVAGFSW